MALRKAVGCFKVSELNSGALSFVQHEIVLSPKWRERITAGWWDSILGCADRDVCK